MPVFEAVVGAARVLLIRLGGDDAAAFANQDGMHLAPVARLDGREHQKPYSRLVFSLACAI